jgi:hypothetical protein
LFCSGYLKEEKEVRKLRKLIMLAAMLAVVLLAASPALAQDEPAVVADAKADAKAKDGTVPVDPKDLPKSGGVTLGSSAVILPGVALLAGGGLLMYSIVRRR